MAGLSLVVLCCYVTTAGAPLQALPREDLRWIGLDSEHFRLIGTTAPERMIDIATTMERFRSTLIGLMPDSDDANLPATPVFVFGSRQTFLPYNLRTRSGRPAETGGYCVRSLNGYYIAIDATPGFLYRPLVYHEFVHQLVFSRYPGLPLWFHEGIAEYFSTLVVDDDQVRVGLAPVPHLEWLAENPTPSLRMLFATRADGQAYDEKQRAGAFYAGSWLFVHYLLHDGGGSPLSLRQLLELVSPDKPFHETLGSRLNVDDLESAFRAYGDRSSYAVSTLAVPSAGTAGDYEVHARSRESVLAMLGELLTFALDDYSAGEAHLRATLAIAPEQPTVAAALGYSLQLQGQGEEATRWFDAAARWAPDDGLPYLLRGYALLAEFIEAPPAREVTEGRGRARIDSARSVFRKCTELEPERAACQAGLGLTYRFAAGDPAEGIRALERAYALRPEDEESASILAVLYAQTGRIEQGERLMAVLETSSRNAALVQTTRQVFSAAKLRYVWELVNKGKIAEARAALGSMIVRTSDLAQRRTLESELRRVDHYDRYTRAVRWVNAGRRTEAVELLLKLDSEVTDPEIAGFVRELLTRLGPVGREDEE